MASFDLVLAVIDCPSAKWWCYRFLHVFPPGVTKKNSFSVSKSVGIGRKLLSNGCDECQPEWRLVIGRCRQSRSCDVRRPKLGIPFQVPNWGDGNLWRVQLRLGEQGLDDLCDSPGMTSDHCQSGYSASPIRASRNWRTAGPTLHPQNWGNGGRSPIRVIDCGFIRPILWMGGTPMLRFAGATHGRKR